MARLVADCPGNHVHEPYGRKRNEQGQLFYATAEEAAYPRALCLQIRKIVQESLNLRVDTQGRKGGSVSTLEFCGFLVLLFGNHARVLGFGLVESIVVSE